MTKAPARVGAARTSNHLDLLVCRIAGGDRQAFRCLYAFLAVRVWRDAVRSLRHPVDARAVTRATFVEVWYTAGHHVDHPGSDTASWASAIVARHVRERLRTPDPPCAILGDYDRNVHHELVALLGAGPATVQPRRAGRAAAAGRTIVAMNVRVPVISALDYSTRRMVTNHPVWTRG